MVCRRTGKFRPLTRLGPSYAQRDLKLIPVSGPYHPSAFPPRHHPLFRRLAPSYNRSGNVLYPPTLLPTRTISNLILRQNVLSRPDQLASRRCCRHAILPDRSYAQLPPFDRRKRFHPRPERGRYGLPPFRAPSPSGERRGHLRSPHPTPTGSGKCGVCPDSTGSFREWPTARPRARLGSGACRAGNGRREGDDQEQWRQEGHGVRVGWSAG